ncbi:MAG: heme o synthase [Chloroflexota bacterium]
MRKLVYTTLLAAVSLYVLNVLSGMQRSLGTTAALTSAHHAGVAMAFGLLFLSRILVGRMPVAARGVGHALSAAMLFMGLQAAISAVDWPGQLAGIQSGAHFGLALVVQGLAVLAAALSNHWLHADGPAVRLQFRSPFARLSLLTAAALLGLMITGAITSRVSSAGCPTWPLCTPETFDAWLNLAHRGAVLITIFLAGAMLFRAWRTQRSQTTVLVTATASVVLLAAQALLGARLPLDAPAYLVAVHQATAMAVWATMALLVAAVGLAARTPSDEREEAALWRSRTGMAGDLLRLTKPVVVALLLVTTFAGMVIGARALPAWDLLLWTMLGGFLAAGGSGAINQYIDRFDDSQMQRTQKRPIPAGRLTPGEGLAFGVAATLLSFYLMLAFVNLAAALLTLAGIVYYVVLYSLLLKKTTVQNIVIGGGAGAIPPLVGWAAATGGLNVPALFLFAIVFLWTPPHFWALALVRRSDYARANVPMLPVVRGEKETQRQIWIYTLELVTLTLLWPAFGLGGSVYLIGAGALGLWLLSAAWKVWKQGGNKLAWKMYRYSSMYLAFLFAVMMVDALV